MLRLEFLITSSKCLNVYGGFRPHIEKYYSFTHFKYSVILLYVCICSFKVPTFSHQSFFSSCYISYPIFCNLSSLSLQLVIPLQLTSAEAQYIETHSRLLLYVVSLQFSQLTQLIFVIFIPVCESLSPDFIAECSDPLSSRRGWFNSPLVSPIQTMIVWVCMCVRQKASHSYRKISAFHEKNSTIFPLTACRLSRHNEL